MAWTVWVWLILGFGLLIAGAETLVRGAVRIASRVGLSPLIIGLTVVSFGTSSPELFVSLQSSLAGQGDLSLGNVVGSNIFNVLATLGLAAIIAPLTVSRQLIRLDVPLMIGVSALLLLFSVDGELSRSDGVVLFTGMIVYTTFLIVQGRKQRVAESTELDEYTQAYGFNITARSPLAIAFDVGLLGLGLLLLAGGSQLLIINAVAIARTWGVSDIVIGLTIIAVGTSLPELVTSIVASFRGERDIAVGNAIGSNIFNVLAVIGVAAMVSPQGIGVTSAALHFDIPVMLVVAVACLPIFFTNQTIDRWEGVLFVGYYVAYTAYLIFEASAHDLLPVFSMALLGFAVPLTLLTLTLVTWRAWRDRQRSRLPPS
jgi:cation:H+ antiporter